MRQQITHAKFDSCFPIFPTRRCVFLKVVYNQYCPVQIQVNLDPIGPPRWLVEVFSLIINLVSCWFLRQSRNWQRAWPDPSKYSVVEEEQGNQGEEKGGEQACPVCVIPGQKVKVNKKVKVTRKWKWTKTRKWKWTQTRKWKQKLGKAPKKVKAKNQRRLISGSCPQFENLIFKS